MVPLRKKYKLLLHNGSMKKKVLKYGTPKPSNGAHWETTRPFGNCNPQGSSPQGPLINLVINP